MILNEPQFIISTLKAGLFFPLGQIWVEEHNKHVGLKRGLKIFFLKCPIRARPTTVEYCVTAIILSAAAPKSPQLTTSSQSERNY